MNTRAAVYVFNAILFLIQSREVKAQTLELTPDQQSLVNAEWSFINLAKEKNTRDAFLANVDDHTIVFNNGKLVNAKTFYESPPTNEKLVKLGSYLYGHRCLG